MEGVTESGRVSLAANGPFQSLLGFTVPMVLKGLFRLFCALTSSIVMKGALKTSSLTTMNSADVVVCFMFYFVGKFANKFNVYLKRGYKTGSRGKVHGDITISTLLDVTFAMILALVYYLLSRRVLH